MAASEAARNFSAVLDAIENLFDDTFLDYLDDTLTASDPGQDVDPWND